MRHHPLRLLEKYDLDPMLKWLDADEKIGRENGATALSVPACHRARRQATHHAIGPERAAAFRDPEPGARTARS